MKLAFTKMEGLGNDYIYVDGIQQEVPMDEKTIRRLSDRHFGIGSDGMIVVLPSQNYDFKMRMFNLDGSEAMMCGNGIRCFAKFCYDQGLTNKKRLHIETKAGLRIVELLFSDAKVVGAKVNMGKPILQTKAIPCLYPKDQMIQEPLLVETGTTYEVTALSMGNPHAVIFVNDLDIPVSSIGAKLESHSLFPNSVNTEFVQVVSEEHINMRVWERGSGETLACGTGACAAMYASYITGKTKDVVRVDLLGGTLKISYVDGEIFMEGPATTVFEGNIII